MSDQDNTDFIKELERKSAFGMWQDYCDMKEQLTETEQALSDSKARNGRLREAIAWALGYTKFRQRGDGEGADWWRTE